MRMTRVAVPVAVALFVAWADLTVRAQPRPIAAWRAQHERQIVDEFLQLVSIPNVAGNDADMRRNADLLETLFARRGFMVEKTDGPGSPVVFATLDVPSPRGTLTLYIHYDGQPVEASEWTRCKPFAPCIYGPTGPVQSDPARMTFDPQWRVYGRSASDDKGPIVAVLNAVEALRATMSSGSRTPSSRALTFAADPRRRALARQPTLGGSMPFATFSTQMPTVGFSMVNHDNNQHGPDENLRLQSLWEGIEMMAAIMTMTR